MEDPWISRQETAAFFQVKIYCSICGSLIEPESIPHILNELSNELRHSDTALRCDSDVLERRYFNGTNGYAWISLYRLSRSTLLLFIGRGWLVIEKAGPN